MRTSRLVLLSLSMLLSMLVLPIASTAQGNSGAAQACQKGGYLNYTDADGNSFRNPGQCVSYVARGGTLVPVPIPTPALSISGGLTDADGVISGTGFTPSTKITTLDREFFPIGGKSTIFSEGLKTDSTGAFDSSNHLFCFGSETTNDEVVVTATDAAGVSHTESFALSCNDV